jgi:predicted transcriptional regulator
MNTIASNNTLYGQFFDLIKIQNQRSKTIPLTENGKKLLNEVYSNRFF